MLQYGIFLHPRTSNKYLTTESNLFAITEHSISAWYTPELPGEFIVANGHSQNHKSQGWLIPHRIVRRNLKTFFMETLLTVAITLAVVYCVIGIFALIMSDKLIFPAPPSSYTDSSEIIKIPAGSGNSISALYLPNPAARYTLLFSHGNGEDLGRVISLLKMYHQFGFSVFAYDYSGYGTSTGKPTEKSAVASIDAVYDYMTGTLSIPPDRIIAYGRSVGGGPTLDLAARKPFAGIIIEGSFVTAFRVMTHVPLLPWDKFRNIRNIKKVNAPVLIIHATDDEVVPFWHGQALFDRANSPKSYLWVEGSGHNNLLDIAGEAYWDTLKHFVEEVDKQ